jgi:hypothetical protein
MSTAIHFCRGCGEALPPQSTLFFHPACRKADKRRRVTEQRRREAERREQWLRRQRCPHCGGTLKELAFSDQHPLVGTTCDASQGAPHNAAHTEGAMSPTAKADRLREP